jgi:hypothetical protein
MATGVIEVPPPTAGVFPNPIKSVLHAHFGERLTREIRVVDLVGRSMWWGKGNGMDHLDLPVTDWARGGYLLQWMARDGRHSLKFMIAK